VIVLVFWVMPLLLGGLACCFAGLPALGIPMLLFASLICFTE